MQKLPGKRMIGKRDDACVEKKGTSRQGGELISLSGSDRRIDNTSLTGGKRHAYVFGGGFG